MPVVSLSNSPLDRSILHDETLFPNPDEFKPERYLDEQGRIAKNSKQVLAVKTAFGFGRRFTFACGFFNKMER